MCTPGPRQTKPISYEPMADPFIFRDGSDWYVFGTMPYLLEGKALTPESLKRVDLHIDFGPTPVQMWGFTLYKHTDGSYHAYATLHYGHFRTVIGHLVPDKDQKWSQGHPITDWRLDKILVGDVASGWDAYDSKVIRDGDGTLYLVYVAHMPDSTDNCIWAHRMLDPDNLDPSYKPRILLHPDGYRSEDRNPGYMQLVEGANFTRIAGKYVMCYSVGDYLQDNYKLALAYSDSLIPPEGKYYHKVLVPDHRNLWGNPSPGKEVKYLLQSQIQGWPNYCRSIAAGPGVGSIVNSNGRYWLVFHGYMPVQNSPRSGSDRYSWILPLEVDFSAKTWIEDWIRPLLPGTTEAKGDHR